ncbi:MAG: DUF86 domain-containing protein [Methanoregula sp.]|nr:DUF86 domain-containing protein [Methanoregula sp.]
MRTDLDRLRDIHEALERIAQKLPRAKEEFLQSDMHQVWVLYHIQLIGEAANGISAGFRKAHGTIPWKKIIAMRHLLVHQYFGIDLDEVWNTTQKDLPQLRQEISRILKNK